MHLYSIGFRTLAPAANGFWFDIKAGAAERIFVREIGLFNVAATIQAGALFRTATLGTRTTPTILQPNDPSDPAVTSDVATAWSAVPTVVTIPLRRIHVPATIGAGFIWTFERLVILQGASIACQAIAAGGICDGYVLIEA